MQSRLEKLRLSTSCHRDEAAECVHTIITDLAVIDVTPQGLSLREVTPGWTTAEVQQFNEPKLDTRALQLD